MAEISVPSLSTTFNAVAGDQYFIVIDGTDGSTGTFNLAWEPARSTTGYSVSGFIKSSIGTPVANVPVQLVGATSKTSVTDVNGQYQFSGVAAGTYMVQPSSTSYTFGPPSWSIEVDDDDLTGIDFLAVTGITLGGRVTDKNGNGLPGVLLTCKGKRFSSSTTTNSQGFYAFPGMTAGAYTVKASASRIKFAPASRNVKLETTSLTNTNFAAR
jgi:hypothetical protein